MLWLVCGADTHPSGFAFAMVRGEAVPAWCKREEDAQATVEAHEAAPEIAAWPSQGSIGSTRGSGAALGPR